MTMSLSLPALVSLIIAASLGYVLATAGMKLAAVQTDNSSAILLIVLGFAAAAIAEVILLRSSELSVVYVTIIATETILIISLALMLGDTIEPRQWMGAGLAFAGVLLTLT